MKVSVIVPIYNVAKFLDRSICSIINQRYQNIEIILVNDGSTDESLEICKAYEIKDSRIIIIDKANGGLSSARNIGICKSTGDFLLFIDPDDEIDSDMIFDMLYRTEQNTAKINIIGSNIKQYNCDNTNYIEVKNNLPYNRVLNVNEIRKYLLKSYYDDTLGIISSACTKLYNTKFIRQNSLYFDETLKRSEDYWFNFHCLVLAEKVFFVNKAYYNYYSNSGSMIKSFREGQYAAFVNNRRLLLEYNQKLNIKVDWGRLNTKFIGSVNEYLLLATINNRADIVKKILHDKTYNDCLQNYNPVNLHTKLIKFFQKNGMISMTKMLLKLWSTKVK